MANLGTLYGIGTGPGDPELLTVKAVRLLQSVAVVGYWVDDSGNSRARNMVANYLSNVTELPLQLPITSTRETARQTYEAAAQEVYLQLKKTQDVAFLCVGEPLLYGSFIYLLKALQPITAKLKVEIVPGVTGMSAAAAAAGLPLASEDSRLALVSGRNTNAEILLSLAHYDTVVIYKVGRHFRRLLQLVADSGRYGSAYYVENASLPQQRVQQLVEFDPNHTTTTEPEFIAPYFSCIIVVGNDN